MFLAHILKYLSSDTGATAIEYGLIAAGIALGIALVVFAFGAELVVIYDEIANLLIN